MCDGVLSCAMLKSNRWHFKTNRKVIFYLSMKKKKKK